MRKYTCLFTMLAVAIAFPLAARGAAFLTEGFDYLDGSVLTDTTAGGTGWTTSGDVGWRNGYTHANLPSQLQAERDHTWSVPTGYTPLVPDGAVRNDNESVARQGARVLDDALDADGQTFYVSFLIQPDANEPGWVNLGLRRVEGSMTGGAADTAMFQMDGSTLQMEFQSGATLATVDSLVPGQDYLVVARFITSATPNADDVAFAFYGAGDDVSTEPDWTALGNNGAHTTSAELNGLLTHLTLRMNDESLVGSIRVATHYTDVLSEPATASFPIFDPVDYPLGGLENTATAGYGSGWYNGWTWSGDPLRDPGTFGSSSLQAVSKTWDTFLNYSAFANAIAGDPVGIGKEGSRAFAAPFDPQPLDDEAVYFSYMFHGAVDGPGWLNLVFRNGTGSTLVPEPQSLQIQYNGSSKVMSVKSDAGNASTSALTPGQDYLVVGRLLLSSTPGGDAISIAVLNPSDDAAVEPDWTGGAPHVAHAAGDLFTDGVTHYPVDNLTVRINDSSLIGSIRIGESYAQIAGPDVVIPTLPEWGLIALAVVILAAGWRVLQRRQQPEGAAAA